MIELSKPLDLLIRRSKLHSKAVLEVDQLRGKIRVGFVSSIF